MRDQWDIQNFEAPDTLFEELDKTNEGPYKGDNKAYNDPYKWVELFDKTVNTKDWGLGNIDIEVEII